MIKRTISLVLIFLILVIFPVFVAAAEGGDSDPKPSVQLVAGDNNQLAPVQTTQASFCAHLFIHETGGAASETVELTALQMVVDAGSDTIGPVPSLSLEGCEAIGEKLTLTLGAYAYKIVYLFAELKHIGTYTGEIILQHGENPVDVYSIQVTRNPSQAPELEVFPITDGKFTLNTKAETFNRTLRITLPQTANPIANLTYSYSIERSDGIARYDADISLLYEDEDVNAVDLPLNPGVSLDLTLEGSLPEIGEFNGQLLIDYGQTLPKIIELVLTRERYAQLNEGLALATPEPPRWQTGLDIWNGASGVVAFDLNITEAQSLDLNPPELVNLVRVEEGKVVDNLIGRVVATPSLVNGEGKTEPGHHTVDLNIEGLSAGEYHTTVRISVHDGREIEGTASIFVRHHSWLAVVVMALGILFAWFLQNWGGGGRSRALIERQLSYVEGAILKAKDEEELNKWPIWINETVIVDLYQNKLLPKLIKDRLTARLQRDANQLQAVYDDVNTRVHFLLDGLDLASDVDQILNELKKQKVLTDDDCQKVQSQMSLWYETLFDQIERLEKAQLEDEKKGAPLTLGLIRGRLLELRRLKYQQRLDQIQADLNALGQETITLKEEAVSVIEVKITKGAKEKLEHDDYLATEKFLMEAESEHADLRLQQMGLQLATLEGKRPESLGSDEWKMAAEAIKAVRDKLATLPPNANTDQKLNAWMAALPLYTLAQVKVLEILLDHHPFDMTPKEWQSLREKHSSIDGALAEAVNCLTTDPVNLAAGQRHYRTALTELTWFHRDLVASRLKRLSEEETQLPLGLSGDDPRWAFLRARTQDQLDSLPIRQYTTVLSESQLIQIRGHALQPLVGRLELAYAAIMSSSACDVPQQHEGVWKEGVQDFVRALQRSQKLLAVYQQSDLSSGTEVTEDLQRAERSYEAAYAFYEQLIKLCKSISEPTKLGVLTWKTEGVERILTAASLPGPDLWTDFPLRLIHGLVRTQPVRIPVVETLSKGIRDKLEKSPSSWERMIGLIDKTSFIVAFVVALLGGVATKITGQATFGQFQDYLIAALWGFGVAEVTNASLGELRKALFKEG